MRILYFTRDYTPHDHRFLSSLAQTEHEVFYLRLERSGHQQEDRSLPDSVHIVRWVGGTKPLCVWAYPRLLASLRKVLKQVKPDVVHAGPLHTAAFLAAIIGFQPLVSMSWGSDLLLDADKNWIYRWITRFVFRRSAILIGDCDTVRQKAISFGIPEKHIVTFPWGINLQQFTPGEDVSLRERIGWQDAFVLLHTRSWERVYGVDVVARAFVKAAAQIPELRLFMLAGGSQAAKLRRMLSSDGLQARVHFAGQVGQAELPSYYQAADLYISASHSDGSSISLLEAMASGVPVLVSDIPGNREWVAQEESGWMFPDGDVNALAQAIIQTYEQRDKLPQIVKAAREQAEARADWNKNFKELLRAYQLATA